MSWPVQRARGYTVRYALRVQGIGAIFVEGGAADAAVPAGCTAHGCLVPKGQWSVDADREAGLAAGRPWPQLLAWEDLPSGLFVRPEHTAYLIARLDGSETVVATTSTAGWPTQGTAYIGRERVAFVSSGGPTLTLTRPTLTDVHEVGTPIATAPLLWRGRHVEVWQHLADPAGHLLAETWCEGEWARCIWRGEVSEPPEPGEQGITLHCLPLHRLLDRPIGAEARGRTLAPLSFTEPGRVLTTAADRIVLQTRAGSTVTPYVGASPGVQTMHLWAARCGVEIADDAVGTDGILGLLGLDVSEDSLGVGLRWTTGTIDRVWWVADHALASPEDVTIPAELLAPGPPPTVGAMRRLPWRDASTGWLELELEVVGTDLPGIPATGVLALTVDGVEELARYVDRIELDDTHALVRIVERDRLGTGRADIWRAGGSWSLAPGMSGLASEASLTVLQSSGTGTRGDYDTAPSGLAIEESAIDVASWQRWPLSSTVVDGSARGPESVREQLGGWLTLHGLCAAMVRGRIAVVGTEPIPGSEIGPGDVLLGGHSPAQVLVAPTVVRVTSGTGDRVTTRAVRDASAVAASGAIVWDVRAPGSEASQALWLAVDLLRLGQGQVAVTLELPEWVDVDVGDPVTLTTAHPSVYSWVTGERGEAAIAGRVVGRAPDVESEIAEVTVLLEGLAGPAQWLAPTLRVVDDDGNDVAIVEGRVDLFEVGDEVTHYSQAGVSLYLVRRRATIVDIDGDEVTIDDSSVAWIEGDCLTLAAWDEATATQRAYAYLRGETRWW